MRGHTLRRWAATALTGAALTITTTGTLALAAPSTAAAAAETPAQRCQRETAQWNTAYETAWRAANPGNPGPPPPNPAPYVCIDPGEQPTTTPPPIPTLGPAPTGENNGTGIAVHAGTAGDVGTGEDLVPTTPPGVQAPASTPADIPAVLPLPIAPPPLAAPPTGEHPLTDPTPVTNDPVAAPDAAPPPGVVTPVPPPVRESTTTNEDHALGEPGRDRKPELLLIAAAALGLAARPRQHRTPESLLSQTVGTLARPIMAYAPGDTSRLVIPEELGGLRTFFLIHDPTSPHEAEIATPPIPHGGTLRINPDGTASILDAHGTETDRMAAPWAYDTHGNPIPTHYIVRNGKLIQQVHADHNTAYPILADPDKTVVEADGSVTEEYADGAWINRKPLEGGDVLVTTPEGMPYVEHPDGSHTTTGYDLNTGAPTTTTYDSGGGFDQAYTEYPDGAWTATVGGDDGSRTTYYPDSTPETVYPDGSKATITYGDDGSETLRGFNPDQTRSFEETTYPDGAWVRKDYLPDGGFDMHYPDAPSERFDPDGTRTARIDGNFVRFNEAGEVVSSQSAAEKATADWFDQAGAAVAGSARLMSNLQGHGGIDGYRDAAAQIGDAGLTVGQALVSYRRDPAGALTETGRVVLRIDELVEYGPAYWRQMLALDGAAALAGGGTGGASARSTLIADRAARIAQQQAARAAAPTTAAAEAAAAEAVARAAAERALVLGAGTTDATAFAAQAARISLTAEQAEAALQAGRELVGSPRALPNSRYAGDYYPLAEKDPPLAAKYPNGVYITPQGFPDFSPYAVATVRLDQIGPTRPGDFARANAQAGIPRTPRGWVWHHVEDAHTLHLIPRDLHIEVSHHGGWSRMINVLMKGTT